MLVEAKNTKAAEEGDIWEWRAFGQISSRLAAAVKSHPVRFNNLTGTDVYLIAPASNQNVKLRRTGDDWTLKFKLLLRELREESLELYRETGDMTFTFPVSASVLQRSGELLAVKLRERLDRTVCESKSEFIEAFDGSTPRTLIVEVAKRRSQFLLEGGWVELADVVFPECSTQSISLHSRNLEAIRRLHATLQPEPELEVLNYVEACRRIERC